MKVLVFFIFILSSSLTFGQQLRLDYSWEKNDFFLPWPSRINSTDFFYRGQATNLTTFTQMLEMITAPKENSFVTSRLLRTLKKIYPDKSLKELLTLVDSQMNWWRKNKIIWKITYCHVDVYGCSMPSVKELIGVIFNMELLPDFIKKVYERQEQGGVSYLDFSEMARVLEFFDPIVSTSFYQSVAEKFAKDKQGGVGYIMILNDKLHRNCKEDSKRSGNCFINHEDYLEEFEVPFWGYVLPEELEGFIVENIKLLRNDDSSFFIIQNEQKMTLSLKSLNRCQNLSLFDFDSSRKQKLLISLKSHLLCKN